MKDTPNPTTIVAERFAMFAEEARQCCVDMRRRRKHVRVLQKTVPPGDPVADRLAKEVRDNLDSVVNAMDRLAKILIKPPNPAGDVADAAAVMEELTSGTRRKVG